MIKDDETPTCGARGNLDNGDLVNCDRDESHGGRHRYTFPQFTYNYQTLGVMINGRRMPSTLYIFWDQS